MTSRYDLEKRLAIHTDPQGYYWSVPGQLDGNCILFMSELISWGADSLPKDKLRQKLEALETYGILRRHPLIEDHEGPDDYFGLMTTSGLFAKRFLNRGRQTGYLYNSQDPTAYRLGSDFSRFPALIAQAQWRTGEKPCRAARLVWLASLANATYTPNRSHRCLGLHLAWLGLHCPGDRENKVSKLFFRRMRKLGFRTFGDVRANYHGNPEHSVKYFCSKELPS